MSRCYVHPAKASPAAVAAAVVVWGIGDCRHSDDDGRYYPPPPREHPRCSCRCPHLRPHRPLCFGQQWRTHRLRHAFGSVSIGWPPVPAPTISSHSSSWWRALYLHYRLTLDTLLAHTLAHTTRNEWRTFQHSIINLATPLPHPALVALSHNLHKSTERKLNKHWFRSSFVRYINGRCFKLLLWGTLFTSGRARILPSTILYGGEEEQKDTVFLHIIFVLLLSVWQYPSCLLLANVFIIYPARAKRSFLQLYIHSVLVWNAAMLRKLDEGEYNNNHHVACSFIAIRNVIIIERIKGKLNEKHKRTKGEFVHQYLLNLCSLCVLYSCTDFTSWPTM